MRSKELKTSRSILMLILKFSLTLSLFRAPYVGCLTQSVSISRSLAIKLMPFTHLTTSCAGGATAATEIETLISLLPVQLELADCETWWPSKHEELLPLDNISLLCETASAMSVLGDSDSAIKSYRAAATLASRTGSWAQAHQAYAYMEHVAKHSGRLTDEFNAVYAKIGVALESESCEKAPFESMFVLALKAREPVWCQRAALLFRRTGMASSNLSDACSAFGVADPRAARACIARLQMAREGGKAVVETLQTLGTYS